MTARTPWMAAAAVVGLRSLPFLRVAFGSRGEGGPFVLASYLPNDWLPYVALVREQAPRGGLSLANPFTTEVQDGRLIILLHQVLNLLHRQTGADPFWLFELSRIPVTFAFFLVLWRLLGRIGLSRVECAWATWLVAMSGGLDWLVRLSAPLLPTDIAETVTLQLSGLIGWSTFGALWNPLWVSGLTLLVYFVSLLLVPNERRAGWTWMVAVGLTFLLLWLTHPYSGLAALVVMAGAWMALWLADIPVPGAFLASGAASVGMAIAGIGLLSLWQLGDPVQRALTGGIFGSQGWGAFWYPVTIGPVALLSFHGRSSWIGSRRAWGTGLFGWAIAIALLHSSPILNGHHFVAYLYLPLCILAAPGAASFFQTAGLFSRLVVAAILFSSPLALTWDAVRDAGERRLPPGMDEVVATLARARPGNVLATADAGNVIPAFAQQRVYVGHFFMTPAFESHAAVAERALSGRDPALLRSIVRDGRIDYVVCPSSVVAVLALALGDMVSGTRSFGPWAILFVSPT
jgi:hypothetical protein